MISLQLKVNFKSRIIMNNSTNISYFKIGEVVKRTGVTASAIRYYESIGIVPKPGRKHGCRMYDET